MKIRPEFRIKSIALGFAMPPYYPADPNLLERLRYWWGIDLFYGFVPVVKLIILTNIIVWLVLFGG